MIRAHWWVIALAGCGRVHFDALANDASDARTTDGSVAINCTPSPEICDGIDNNCDGQIEEGCPCTPFDVMLSLTGPATVPTLTWTGTGYLVTYTGPTQTVVQTLAANGAAGNVAMTGGFNQFPVAAWSGTRLAIATIVSNNVFVTFFDPSTGMFSSTLGPINTSVTAMHVELGWFGDRFGVSWNDGSTMAVRELDATGAPRGPEQTVATIGSGLWNPRFAATDHGYLFGDGDMTTPTVYAIDMTTGVTTPHAVDLGGGTTNSGCWLAPGPGGAIATRGTANAAFSAALIDSGGTPTGVTTDVPLTPLGNLSVQPWRHGDRYRLEAITSGATHTVEYVEVDAFGTVTTAQATYFTFSSTSYNSVVAADAANRHAIAVMYDVSSNPTHLHVVQVCN